MKKTKQINFVGVDDSQKDKQFSRSKRATHEELRSRSTWWFLETYNPSITFDYGLSKASHWAYIFHDCDFYDDLTKVEPHYHILLHYDNARSGYACLRDFIGSQNTFVEKAYSPVGSYEYLTHKNDIGKTQYPDSRIVSHNPVYWEHFLPSVRDRTQADFIEDLLAEDELDLVYMARKYGRDFIKNYRSYLDFRYEVRAYDKRPNFLKSKKD